VRLLPRRREADACDCRLCRAGSEDLDDRDRKAISDVQQYGVHVVLVSDSFPCTCANHDEHAHAEPSGEPDFAYTVGLWHQRRHPELLMSGLPNPKVMHRALNDLSAWVAKGEVLRPGVLYEDVLGGVPVTVEELTEEARARMVTWSAWFHRRDVPALQVVWPDLEGVFAWQGAAPVVDERQPPRWRVPGPRRGALAPEPSWPFPVGRDALAFTCTHVVEGEAPALYVQRDADDERVEDWSVSCGEDHEGTGELVMAHLSHLVVRSPGLREVADLRLGQWARREDARSPWQRYGSGAGE
jgi:hypothetical protein